MSWLQNIIKLSSWNIKFTDDIYGGIDGIAKNAADYYVNNIKMDDAEAYSITNPYTNAIIELKVVFFSHNSTIKNLSTGKLQQGVSAVYNPANNTLSLFPYNDNILTSNTDYNMIYKRLKYSIQHEIAHALDPKIYMDRKETVPGSFEYYASPTEFDAYSKQIIEEVKDSDIYNNTDNINRLLRWVRSSELSINVPCILSKYIIILEHWQESDRTKNTNYIRKFKIRIYNEMFSTRG